MKEKQSFIIAILLFLSCSSRKTDEQLFNKNKEFSLSLSTSNHAEVLFKGVMSYEIKDDSFKIIRHLIVDNTDILLFSKPIETNLIEQIESIKLDTLQDLYFNKCVMGTSGTEYEIAFKHDTVSKNVLLHHFYQKEIDRLVRVLNTIVPEEYKIEFMDSDTKQDCK